MSPKPPKPPLRRRRTASRAAHVVARALIGVAQHVVGVRHELEALGRVLAGVHVGVQLACEAPVRLLDLVGRRVARDAEDLVVVSHNRLPVRGTPRDRLVTMPRQRAALVFVEHPGEVARDGPHRREVRRVVHARRAEHADAGARAGRVVVAGDDGCLAQPERLVLASDARGETVLVGDHLAHELQERHLLLDRLEERVDAAAEVRLRGARGSRLPAMTRRSWRNSSSSSADDAHDGRSSRPSAAPAMRARSARRSSIALRALAHRAADQQRRRRRRASAPDRRRRSSSRTKREPLRHAAGVGDEDHQHPPAAELHELDVRDVSRARTTGTGRSRPGRSAG